MVQFLDLPFEIREHVYIYLLILLPSSSINPPINDHGPLLHPAILSTCHQIHAEALPLLYTKNTFQCHPTLLTSFPRLLINPRPQAQPPPSPKQLTETSCPGVNLICRWYLHARLDCGPFWDAETVGKAFTGAEELELEVWQSQFGDGDIKLLRRFEGVRGVRRVRIWGSTTGVEGYVAWLEGAMRSPVGSEVARYEESVGGTGQEPLDS